MRYFQLFCCLLVGLWTTQLTAQDIANLPFFDINQLEYEGAFRLPAATFGVSSLNYSEGPIEYNPDNHSIFIVGHDWEQAIAEFTVPDLVNSASITDLNMADPPLQTFSTVLDRTPDGNPQNINQIGGLKYVANSTPPALIVNAYEYYDAPGDNTVTTLILRDGSDLAASAVDGYLEFQGGSGHTSGWLSPIPTMWQAVLGGDYLTGQSSGIPIISRCSVGPSAFAFVMDDMLAMGASTIATHTLLDFSLDEPLHSDLSNDTFLNDIWTHLSRATYGFIVPDTRTYMTVGYSGGHVSGVCYKCTQNNGHLCGGYCAPDAEDYYQHYWLWDVQDLLAVKEGLLLPHEVVPYDYGELATPFQNSQKQIGGGSFDPVSGSLYLTIQRADNEQGDYDNPPIVVVYKVATLAKTIEAQVFLEGAYMGSQNMSTHLADNNLLPLSQPFGRAPWNYSGVEKVATLPNEVTDWLLLEIVNMDDPTQVEMIERRAAFVRSDGVLIDLNGTEGVTFYTLNETDNYHLLVRSRNHLAIASEHLLTLPQTMPYDFTEVSNVMGGSGQVQALGDGYVGMKSGDFNSDGVVTVTDFNNYTIQASLINQYLDGDGNLDGNVTVTDFNFYTPHAGVIGVEVVRY